MHTTHAFGVVDEEAAAVPFHALGGAQVDDFGFDVELAPVTTGVSTGVGGEFAGNVGFHSFLIDLDVVLPRTHDGKVGTGHSGHAAVRAAVELELELVGEGGTVQLVLIVHGELIASVLRVVAGVFAAALAKAGGRRTEVRTGTAEVDVKLVGEIVEDLQTLISRMKEVLISPAKTSVDDSFRQFFLGLLDGSSTRRTTDLIYDMLDGTDQPTYIN